MQTPDEAGAAVTVDDTAGSELASKLRLSLMRAARRLRSQRADTTVTMTQLSVLATLAKSGPLTAGQLASIERVQRPSMTRVLKSLTALDLIEPTASDNDRRQLIVSISPGGQALLDDELLARDAWLAQRLQHLASADIDALRAVIPVLDRLSSE